MPDEMDGAYDTEEEETTGRGKQRATTKRELVERISRKLGHTQRATRDIVQMFLD